jgi:hypothetical protein
MQAAMMAIMQAAGMPVAQWNDPETAPESERAGRA